MSLKEKFSTEAQANELIRAATKGELAQVLDMVVNKNIPADSADSDGNTALMQAAATENIEMAALLIGNGADVNAKNRFDAPVIQYAFAHWEKDGSNARIGAMVDLLLSFDADPLQMQNPWADQRAFIAFRAAALGNEKALAAMLDSGVEVDARNRLTESLLVVAAGKGHDHIVALLLKRGADANDAQALGRTALRAAMEGGHFGSVQVLLAANADTGATSRDEKTNSNISDLQFSASSTPEIAAAVAAAAVKFEVNTAAAKGDSERLEELLKNGAPPDTFDRGNMTGLLHAVQGGHRKAVKVLLDYRADANLFRAEKDRLSALHIAVFNRDMRTIELLGAAGASTYTPDLGGNTPVQRAEKVDNPDMLKLLRKLRGEEIARLSKNAVSLEQEVSAPAKATFRRKAAAP